MGQAVCLCPVFPQVKHRRALVHAGGRVSTPVVVVSVGRLFPQVLFAESIPEDVLLSSVTVLLRYREFPVQVFAVNFVCCSTNKARCLASATELGSNWCNMVCSCILNLQ